MRCPECDGTGWVEVVCDWDEGPRLVRCTCRAGHEALLLLETERRAIHGITDEEADGV